MQQMLFQHAAVSPYKRPKGSLLKWIGNKYRMAEEISSYFPEEFGTFYDPFIGSGALLGTVAPQRGVGSDSFPHLVAIWSTLRDDPETIKSWYSDRWHFVMSGDKRDGYEQVKSAYNSDPNAADFLFLTRSCYGGVVRFRKADGYMSTPCGPHRPIAPEAFNSRVDAWHARVQGSEFRRSDYSEVMKEAKAGDLIYCDPPYSHSQTILYGAQEFSLNHLFHTIAECKKRGVFVALSIDGSKRSGDKVCELPIPEDLFEREIYISVGRSMLKRFQSNGKTLEKEVVADRLLLTY